MESLWATHSYLVNFDKALLRQIMEFEAWFSPHWWWNVHHSNATKVKRKAYSPAVSAALVRVLILKQAWSRPQNLFLHTLMQVCLETLVRSGQKKVWKPYHTIPHHCWMVSSVIPEARIHHYCKRVRLYKKDLSAVVLYVFYSLLL